MLLMSVCQLLTVCTKKLKPFNFKVNVNLVIRLIFVIYFHKNKNNTKCKCFQDHTSNDSINSQVCRDAC